MEVIDFNDYFDNNLDQSVETDRDKYKLLKKIAKWTVISLSGLFGTGIVASGSAIYYYSRPAEVDCENATHAPRSKKGIYAIIREEYGYGTEISQKFVQKDYEVDHMSVGIEPMLDGLTIRILIELDVILNESEDSEEALAEDIEKAKEYMATYQMSEEQIANAKPSTIDCNDYAFRACQRMERHGIPMYLLSICPRDPYMRCHKPSHQVAFCKLCEGKYIFFDNDNVIEWHGSSLDQFAAQYHIDNPDEEIMGVFPFVGISEFVQPEHNNPGSKILIQLFNVTNEDNIKSLDVDEEPSDSSHKPLA